MADLPEYTLERADPFKVCSLDLFGPLLTRGIGGYRRKTFKVWGVLYACLASKAVAIWASAGYDMENFLLQTCLHLCNSPTSHLRPRNAVSASC